MSVIGLVILAALVAGLGIGKAWTDTQHVFVRDEAKRVENELLAEIKRLREQVARLIGGTSAG